MGYSVVAMLGSHTPDYTCYILFRLCTWHLRERFLMSYEGHIGQVPFDSQIIAVKSSEGRTSTQPAGAHCSQRAEPATLALHAGIIYLTFLALIHQWTQGCQAGHTGRW